MASDPSVNYAQQFEDSFHILSQIEGAKIAPNMREESFTNAESIYYDQMGALTEDDRNTRYGRTNYKDYKTFRRRLTVEDKVLAVQIDKPDENKTLADIRNPNIMQFSEAWKRSKDIAGIKGALGTTYGGKNGTDANAFDWTNQLVPVGTGSTASTGLNVDKLRAAKKIIEVGNVDTENPMYQMHMAIAPQQLDDLLGTTEVTSIDYNSVRALVNGDVDTFLGIKFHKTNLLPYMNTAGNAANLDWAENSTYGYIAPTDTDTTDVRCPFLWAQNMVCVGYNTNYKFRAEELQEYNYNFGLFAEWGVGSMRQEEVGVVAVPCDQSPA